MNTPAPHPEHSRSSPPATRRGSSAAANRWANRVQAWWKQTFPTSACTLGEAYEGLLRQALNHANKPAVLLLFMSQCNFNTGYAVYRGGKFRQAPLGVHYGLPMASFEDGIAPEIEAHRLACADVSTNGTIPNDVGHAFATAVH